jgi:hypothetical protein
MRGIIKLQKIIRLRNFINARNKIKRELFDTLTTTTNFYEDDSLDILEISDHFLDLFTKLFNITFELKFKKFIDSYYLIIKNQYPETIKYDHKFILHSYLILAFPEIYTFKTRYDLINDSFYVNCKKIIMTIHTLLFVSKPPSSIFIKEFNTITKEYNSSLIEILKINKN